MGTARRGSGAYERAYDRDRLRRFLSGEAVGEGISRRGVLRLLGVVSASGAVASLPGIAVAGPAAAAEEPGAPGIVKPLPAALLTVRGTNAETNWAALRDTGYHTPVDRFFVRNHTATPLLDPARWRLTVWGGGLRGGAVEFSYADLRALPAVTTSACLECAGNGRSYFTTQQGDPVTGTPWTMGAVGAARWRGARLSDVLRLAGLSPRAVDVMPRGLDAAFVTGGTDHGRVRRPMPVEKALDDVLLAYEMNGRPLVPDHGSPVRLVVPSWAGIASVKWVGEIEVSDRPLFSPWNTVFYRLFGPAHPAGGSAPVTRQPVRSAFELAPGAVFAAGRGHRLTGRSWSGQGGIRRVEVSTDGGGAWRPARLHDAPRPGGWVRWSTSWHPRGPGPAHLLARATDTAGNTQPARSVPNEQGYFFDAVVRHAVEVV
ncbi:sulfite oxidase [Streptomyces telluris]|uniref:Sulfite oxidase n=1 Tax=Streptomyces telluris TaxID=2720021 RepID=A0A9X2LCB1_9ACTN|nr:sulfite oxidase [Streptomyces telluris]MCQ8768535.1 sulfite oxidase [Streptomyces telluris]NJP80463.1 sulfite oxidase [Streptomyces telluris]